MGYKFNPFTGQLDITNPPAVEVDTLQTVTDRGNTTTNNITIDNGGLANNNLNINGSTHTTLRSTATDLFRILHGGTTRIEIDGTGKVSLQNGTAINEFSTDGTLGDNSDDAVPTEKAVVTYMNSFMPFHSDTEENITALTPSTAALAFTTDTEQFYLYDGSEWWEFASWLNTNNSLPDMGYVDDSNRSGYGRDYITDKLLSNVKISGNGPSELGGIRITTDPNDSTRKVFQIYINGAWETILVGINIFQDTTNEDVFFDDFGSDISIISGDSTTILDINGTPMIQAMATSMGALQPQQSINGGTF